MDYAASFRRQKASSTDPDRLEREAKMAEMNERKNLEEAIRWVKDGRAGPLSESSFATVLAAAEAHLATLPNTKTVWEVCATDCLSIVHDTVDDALAMAAGHLNHGRVVRISRLEIPA